MNAPHDLDRRLDDWLLDGPNRAPERMISAALDHARAHPRRRDPLASLRRDPMGSGRFASGSGLRVMPLVAALGLLLVAALAVATVGGLFQGQPVVVPPVATPTPVTTPAPAVTPSPSPLVKRVALIGFDGRTLSTIEVVDGSGALVDARAGQPAEDPSVETPEARNDPGDPATVVLTWNGLLSDEDRRLTIAPDGRTMTLDILPGCGDLLPVVRELVLTFDGPVPADEVVINVVSPPRTCE